MALSVRSNGSGSINLINATWFNDIRDLLTGAMTDQPVTLADGLTLSTANAKLIWNGTRAAANKPVITITPTDTGAKSWSLFSNTDDSLRFFNNTDNLTAFTVFANQNVQAYGQFVLSGSYLNWQNTLSGANKQILNVQPTDAGTTHYGLNYNTDNSLNIFNYTTSINLIRLDSTGNLSIYGTITSLNGSQEYISQQSGSANGHYFQSWSGTAAVIPFSIGGQFNSALAYVDAAGNFFGPVGGGIPVTRAGAAGSVPIYTSTTTPTSPPTGSIWVKA